MLLMQTFSAKAHACAMSSIGDSAGQTNKTAKTAVDEKNKETHPVMKTFSEENDAVYFQLIYIKSGTLILQGCNLSIQSNQNCRARCIYQLPNTSSYISHCSFRGGGPSKPPTAGIDNHHGNSVIQNCSFNGFKSGGVIADLLKDNTFIFKDNAMVSCSLTSVYIQGPGS